MNHNEPHRTERSSTLSRDKRLSPVRPAPVLQFFTVVSTVIVLGYSISVQASEIGSYGHGYVATYQHSLQPEIDTLWKAASIKHPGVTTKGEIASLYSTFESALQPAAEELDTGGSQRVGWASDLIAAYTCSNHKFPAISKSLDQALMARTKLIQLTDRKIVLRIERKLKRYCQPRPECNVGDFYLPRHSKTIAQ